MLFQRKQIMLSERRRVRVFSPCSFVYRGLVLIMITWLDSYFFAFFARYPILKIGLEWNGCNGWRKEGEKEEKWKE